MASQAESTGNKQVMEGQAGGAVREKPSRDK